MKFTKELNPARLLIIGYLSIIALGTFSLCLPSVTTKGISLIDALFTSTSALCVTGLIVKDTAMDFTIWGKTIILFLIQVGGLGYMTLSTTFFFFLGKKISLRDRLLFRESVNLLTYENLRRFAWRIFRITIVLELIGTILLFFAFFGKFKPAITLGHAIFHSVSAFCNAGFSTFSENLAYFSYSLSAPLIVATLIIIGGVGFVVISDSYYVLVKKAKKGLALHTKIVLKTTFILIVLGTIFIFFYEGPRSLAGYSLPQKLIHSLFQAVTPRTAGFNTVTIALFSPITLVMIMIFMFIGASPGGTGGGIKTSTITLIFGWMKELLLGRYGNDITIGKKRIPVEQAFRSILLVFSSIILIIIAFSVIMLLDNPAPMKVLFEVISAFGTVGLSLGSSLNPACNFSFDLSWISKLIIVIVMISGKVGTITLGSALLKPRFLKYSYPQESIIIG